MNPTCAPSKRVALHPSCRPAKLVWREWFAKALHDLPHPVRDAEARPIDSASAGAALVFAPWIDRAVTEWESALTPPVRLSAELVESWRQVLVDRIATLSVRALMLELQVVRLQGRLKGSDTQARFSSFFARLARPSILLRFIDEYPVLGALIFNTMRDWRAFGSEVARHLADDREGLIARFGIDPVRDPLVGLRADGDRHRGGRCVLFARFASGARILYKPRCAKLDLHFGALLNWIANRDTTFQFVTPGVVAGQGHGWHECIAQRPLGSEADGQAFYRRQGEYLALLHALDATDFHCENLIAAGAYPVLLDLEALFHPTLLTGVAGDAAQQASCAVNDSVLRVNLLPSWLTDGKDGVHADIGGASAPERQLTPWPVLTTEAAGTDGMRLVRRPVEFGDGRHCPRYADGGLAVLADHAIAFTGGFERMYAFLSRHRNALCDADGPIANFAGDETRVIIRGTNAYQLVLQESLHPDVLRNAGDREKLIARMLRTIDDGTPSALACRRWAQPFEAADLLAGDVPVFKARVGSPGVCDGRGARVPHLFPEAADAAASRGQARLRRLGPDDLRLQRWVIATAMATLGKQGAAVSGAWPPMGRPRRTSRRRNVHADALAYAAAVGDRLEQLAYRDGGSATWLGLEIAPGAAMALAPLGTDLYDGQPGVVLFLAYLAKLQPSGSTQSLVDDALATWLRTLDATRDTLQLVGAFTGWGGIIYALAHLGVVLDRRALIDLALRLARELGPRVQQDEHDDLIDGSAGCIAGLLALHAIAPEPRVLALAELCGDHLLARATAQAAGIAWPSKAGSEPALGGFSHGTAGIAWALMQLARSSGKSRFQQAAGRALEYDRSLFVPAAGNWRDLRVQTTGAPHQAADCCLHWCHGAPGIGMARLRMADIADDGQLQNEVVSALQTTLRRGFGSSHCLCHGALGNLELLVQASRRRRFPGDWQAQCDLQLRRVLDDIDAAGWRCGTPITSADAPGLMTGLAGIGFGLLRAARPEVVPAVLLLDPPLRR